MYISGGQGRETALVTTSVRTHVCRCVCIYILCIYIYIYILSVGVFDCVCVYT
jgi:hypothetical protein